MRCLPAARFHHHFSQGPHGRVYSDLAAQASISGYLHTASTLACWKNRLKLDKSLIIDKSMSGWVFFIVETDRWGRQGRCDSNLKEQDATVATCLAGYNSAATRLLSSGSRQRQGRHRQRACSMGSRPGRSARCRRTLVGGGEGGGRAAVAGWGWVGVCMWGTWGTARSSRVVHRSAGRRGNDGDAASGARFRHSRVTVARGAT